MMHLLKFYKTKLEKISLLSLIISKGISSDCVDFEVSKLLITFRIFFISDIANIEKTEHVVINIFLAVKNARTSAMFPNYL